MPTEAARDQAILDQMRICNYMGLLLKGVYTLGLIKYRLGPSLSWKFQEYLDDAF